MDKNDYKQDFKLANKYISSLAEMLRLSLLFISAIAAFLVFYLRRKLKYLNFEEHANTFKWFMPLIL
jgi:hypothetical protein